MRTPLDFVSSRKRSDVTSVFSGRSGSLAPVRQQSVEADRIEDHAGEDMRADLRALLDHDHRQAGVEFLEPDRRRQAGRAGADDDDVEFHRLARRKLVFSRHLPLSSRLGAGRPAPP
jgi:hypothetical protein